MGNYRQYCPIARASEILAERWTPLIVRNLMFGASTFNAIAAGVPSMSRSMLVKRLDELERAGVVASTPKQRGRGRNYVLTDAGADLAAVIEQLGIWGERWVDVTTERSDPGFALWAWCQVQLDRDALPDGRVLVAFVFPEERPGNRRYWLLVERGHAEVCSTDPGGEPDLFVQARSLPFVDWHRGARDWDDVVRCGDVRIDGTATLRRAFPTWNLRAPAPPPVPA